MRIVPKTVAIWKKKPPILFYAIFNFERVDVYLVTKGNSCVSLVINMWLRMNYARLKLFCNEKYSTLAMSNGKMEGNKRNKKDDRVQ